MRNRIMALLLGLCIFAAPVGVVAADEAAVPDAVLNIETNMVTVTGKTPSGKAGRSVSLIVINPGGSLDNIDASLQHQWNIITGDGGDFTYTFELATDEIGDSGDCMLYFGGDDYDEPVSNKIYYATIGDKLRGIRSINNATADKLPAIIEEYADILGYRSALFNAVNKAGLADKLFAVKNKKPLSEENFSEIQTVMKELAVLEAYNQGLSAFCFSEAGGFLNMELVGFDKLDREGCNLYEIYQSQISAEGQRLLRESLLKKSCANFDELRKLFLDQSMIHAVLYPIQNGYGHISKILTSANAKMVGLDISEYQKLTATGKTDSQLVSGSYTTINDLQRKLDSLLGETSSGGGAPSRRPSAGKESGSYAIDSSTLPNENAPGLEQTLVFDDISDVSWAADAIVYLHKRGVVSGAGDKKFLPNNFLKREEIVKIVCLAFRMQVDYEEENIFSDAENNAWYTPYVNAAYKSGVANGKGDGSFGVGDFITRQDLAVMLFRAMSPEMSSAEREMRFIDSGEIDGYAAEAVNYLAENGIINGFEDGSFRPKQPCTRAECAKIIFEILRNGGNVNE